jgi:cellulose synthase/poly-beta-1,6-N-acetylglucosamine synthase-like glycosyltransferase
MLPALRRIGTPLMLGGTSNHFPREVLDRLGQWDPYNVTEDADLGIRLARAGLDVAVLDSTTFEEAPATFRVWLPQRTRWLKGWMQTYLVHMRRPSRLLGDLGWWRFLTLQCLLGGFLLSAILHPLSYVLLCIEFTRGEPFKIGTTGLEIALWHLALFNLAAGFSSAIALAALMAIRRGWWRLAASAVYMPLYWLLVSFAAYRAVWQLATAPHLWEKTRHGARRRRVGPGRVPIRPLRQPPHRPHRPRPPNYQPPVLPITPSELFNGMPPALQPGPPGTVRRPSNSRERNAHDH